MKEYLEKLRPQDWPSPCFVTDLALLRRNASILDSVQKRTGAKIMLALKCFSQWTTFPVLSKAMRGPLHGCCASSPDEARLAKEEFCGEVHAFAAAWSDEELKETLRYADHVVFNSFAQWRRFRPLVENASEERGIEIECGLRLNPEHSEGAVPIYDPCSPGSRLGIRPAAFKAELEKDPHALDGISGLHFHTLCEQDSDSLARTLESVERHFGSWFPRMKWINFGGGHHITREGYDIARLERCIGRMRNDFGLEVYLEPGEAIALNAGYLHTTVLEIQEREWGNIAILDTSAACHMPDVLEMPYRPPLQGSGEAGEKAYTYRLGGPTCLAGDVIGDYSFDQPLKEGDVLTFGDMAIYSMVKNNTFNGLPLPAIVLRKKSGRLQRLRQFDYSDFKFRLGGACEKPKASSGICA